MTEVPTVECVFCRIVAGDKADQPLVYEDEHTAAFIDPRQVTPGHTLVVPKAHVRDLFELDDVIAAALMRPSLELLARSARHLIARHSVCGSRTERAFKRYFTCTFM